MDIYEKLSAIQTEFKAKKSRYNSFGKYNFRSAEDILEGLKPFIKKYNVVFTVSEELQELGNASPIIISTAKITDSDMKSIEAVAVVGVDLNQKGMQTPQQYGSASSYAKKYVLGNLLLIDDTQDSDATNTHGTSKLKMTDEAFSKAQKYVSDGGSVEAIASKYEMTKVQAAALKKLTSK